MLYLLSYSITKDEFRPKVFAASFYLQILLQFGFLLLWGLSLVKLNNTVKHVERLLPNRSLFAAHGSIILLSIVFDLISIVCLEDAVNAPTNRQLVLAGCANIAAIIGNLFDCIGFVLVLYLMSPVTEKQKKRRKDFQTFLLDGFIDVDHLQSAIFEKNPDMTEEERLNVNRDL